jgi:membrane-associated HD superfamily phosphohydrolase
MTNHYLLSCSISANIRQSVQIKFDDLKLPQSVIDTLVKSNTVSIRPHLSNALKEELDALRVLQRELYDGYCIHYGDCHFVTNNYFDSANKLIKSIKVQANEANERLAKLWENEYGKWQATTENILRPLFADDAEFNIAFAAYMKIFPTKEEYRSPIRVSVLGPLPTTLRKVDAPVSGDIESVIAYENNINTEAILTAAKAQAADKALMMGAELVDDLDCRGSDKVGKQQVGSDKKRGSWEITASKLKLISDSVPGFENLSALATELLETGKDMTASVAQIRTKATEKFYKLQDTIKSELEQICNNRDSSRGLEKLKESLSLSNKYKQLCERIKNAENSNVLNLLTPEVNLELDVYEQRSKRLKKLLLQRKELIQAASGDGLDDLIAEVTDKPEVALDF